MKTYKVMHKIGMSSWANGLSLSDALDSAADAAKTLGCMPYLIDEETDEIIILDSVGTRAEPRFEFIY